MNFNKQTHFNTPSFMKNRGYLKWLLTIGAGTVLIIIFI